MSKLTCWLVGHKWSKYRFGVGFTCLRCEASARYLTYRRREPKF